MLVLLPAQKKKIEDYWRPWNARERSILQSCNFSGNRQIWTMSWTPSCIRAVYMSVKHMLTKTICIVLVRIRKIRGIMFPHVKFHCAHRMLSIEHDLKQTNRQTNKQTDWHALTVQASYGTASKLCTYANISYLL